MMRAQQSLETMIILMSVLIGVGLGQYFLDRVGIEKLEWHFFREGIKILTYFIVGGLTAAFGIWMKCRFGDLCDKLFEIVMKFRKSRKNLK